MSGTPFNSQSMFMKRLQLVGLTFIFSLSLFSLVFGQSQPESSTTYLEVRTQGEYYKTMTSVTVGEKLAVRQGKGSKMIHGKITSIEDSTVVIGETRVPISSVTELNTRLEGETLLAGFLLFLVACGLGLLGWLFGRAMLTGRLTTWWEWTLVGLGALLVVIFGPVVLLGSIIAWAFSRKHYNIGQRLKLFVFKKVIKAAPIDPNFGG
jgi:hypothetical protein